MASKFNFYKCHVAFPGVSYSIFIIITYLANAELLNYIYFIFTYYCFFFVCGQPVGVVMQKSCLVSGVEVGAGIEKA